MGGMAIIPYIHGEETLYLHKQNSEIIFYEEPFEDFSYVNIAQKRHRFLQVWDWDLIFDLSMNDWPERTLDRPSKVTEDKFFRVKKLELGASLDGWLEEAA